MKDNNEIMNIINKHINIYQTLMNNTNVQYEIHDYASAITSLIMLKMELNSEIEY